ncbi:MAG: D-alanyl-D-alanine carboxypeptidase family protein [Gallionellaceae bacterium]
MRYLIGLLLLCQAAVAFAQPDPFPQVATSYLVEINSTLVWEKQSRRRLPPASLTKMMTALLVSEKDQPQAVVSVSLTAARETGTRLHLVPGERFHVHDLLEAMLIDSANDACHALADFVAGNEARFVRMMNRRAQQLGMRDTHYANACGHDEPNHYSSTHDLALLAGALIKRPGITGITARHEADITTLDGVHGYRFASRNALIGRYPGAIGLKTGYTPSAGKCMVAYVERGGNKVLLVMLHGNDRWWDAADILDLAFDHVREFPS